MPISLDQVVPWGRTMQEYQRMFALEEADLTLSILGCGDGPASFNAQWTELGGRVVSCDPIYNFSAADIERRVHETSEIILQGVRKTYDDFLWDEIASPEALTDLRLSAMRRFLGDYENGRREERYLAAALPGLPFTDGQFDLALVSHLLFLYSSQLDFDFHRAALHELLRVASEIRIFPVRALGGLPSPHLEPLMMEWREHGAQVELVQVKYEFLKGANQMLRIRRA